MTKTLNQKKATAAIVLYLSLSNKPEEWTWGRSIDNKYYITHIPSGIKLWIKGSVYIYKPHTVYFNWFDRFMIKLGVRRWKRKSGNGQAQAVEHDVLDKLLTEIKT